MNPRGRRHAVYRGIRTAASRREERDPKGLYKKARAGEIKNFTGIDDPYEAPEAPEVHLHTDQQSLEEEVEHLLALLEKQGLIPAAS